MIWGYHYFRKPSYLDQRCDTSHETTKVDDDDDDDDEYLTLTQVAETQFLKMEKDLEKTHRALVESQEQQSALQLGLTITPGLRLVKKKVYRFGFNITTLFQQEITSTFHGGMSNSLRLTIEGY